MRTVAFRYEGQFYFDPEDPIYAEHFPGNPVVPGSMIIHAFTRAIGESPHEHLPTGVRNFRFKRFVSPGGYAYILQSKADGVFACTLLDNQTAVATGTIITSTLKAVSD